MCVGSSRAAILIMRPGMAAGAGTRSPMPLSALSPLVRVPLALEHGGRTTPCNISALVRSRLDCLHCALTVHLAQDVKVPSNCLLAYMMQGQITTMALLQVCIPYAAESLPGICCRRHCILSVLPPLPCPDRHLRHRPFRKLKVIQRILPPLYQCLPFPLGLCRASM